MDHKLENNRLKFKKFNRLDSGEYTCTVDGKTEKFDLTMTDNHGIEIHTFLKTTDLNKEPSNCVEQVCTAITNRFTLPESLIIQWFKSDGQVTNKINNSSLTKIKINFVYKANRE